MVIQISESTQTRPWTTLGVLGALWEPGKTERSLKTSKNWVFPYFQTFEPKPDSLHEAHRGS